MNRLAGLGLLGLITFSPLVGLRAQEAPSTQSVVQHLDPTGAKLISQSAQVETLKNEFFGFLEGPVWVQNADNGYLLFSDMPANCIYKWENGTLSVFLEKSGFTGTDPSNAGMEVNNGRLQVIVLGSNGLTLDRDNRLIIAQHGDRRLVRRETSGDLSVLADRYEGKRLNGPNDVVVKSNGSIFFTDFGAGLRLGDKSPLKELRGHGIFLVKNGKIIELDNDPFNLSANGIALSPDERTLYVTGYRKLVAYDLRDDDSLANARILFDYDTVTKDPGGYDGIKVDSSGNIWGPGPGGIWVISASGKPLARVRFPEVPANLAFGDADGKSLYVTARRGLYRVRVLTSGLYPNMSK